MLLIILLFYCSIRRPALSKKNISFLYFFKVRDPFIFALISDTFINHYDPT